MGEHHDIAIIGSGFSGLGMAIALRRAGIEDFVVYERGDSLGGTWRDNHYPGCACDVPAPLYSYSFAPNPDWSWFYARHDEIRAYLEDCADRFGVREKIEFGTEVTSGTWLEEEQRWEATLDSGERRTASTVVGGIGGLNRPSLPDIDGLDSFEGPVFHSAEWRHDVDLTGLRVGVIGTGASAIQLIPEVARRAGHTTVFQRTPAWVLPKVDHRFRRAEKELFRRAPIAQRAVRGTVFSVTESLALPITRRPRLLAGLEAVARAHIRRHIRDPDLRRALTPDYRLGCKRLLISSDYYPALARDDVDLVTQPISRMTPRGLVTADGTEHPLDVLVASTGFDIKQVFRSLDITGRGGVKLGDVWSERISAHRGTAVPGFPNLWLLSGPNTGTGSTSQVFMIEAGINYVMEAIRLKAERGLGSLEVRPEAHARYNEWLDRRMARTVWLTGGCNSWYLDENGGNPTLFPGFSSEFRAATRRLRPDEFILEPRRRRSPEPRPAIAA